MIFTFSYSIHSLTEEATDAASFSPTGLQIPLMEFPKESRILLLSPLIFSPSSPPLSPHLSPPVLSPLSPLQRVSWKLPITLPPPLHPDRPGWQPNRLSLTPTPSLSPTASHHFFSSHTKSPPWLRWCLPGVPSSTEPWPPPSVPCSSLHDS